MGFWNFFKPMPPGTHVTSLPARLAESQVDFIAGTPRQPLLLHHLRALIDHAEQLIILDVCPLSGELAQHLLARKRQRPNLKIVLVTDPRNPVYNGTPQPLLGGLEQAGVIVARVRLAQLRDSNPLYSSAWRLAMGWWSDPFDESPGKVTLISTLRRLNLQADERQLLVADDGTGGWTSLIAASTDSGVEVRGHLARDIAASELDIAAWSTDDDRLPGPPPAAGRGMGTVDARFLTEGAIGTAVRDAMTSAGTGDTLRAAQQAIGDRSTIHALLRAASRGAHIELLLDPVAHINLAVAAELMRKGAPNITIRWSTQRSLRFVLVQHRNDVWLNLGSANLIRRDLDDLNLDANIELHLPAWTAPARGAADAFSRAWVAAAPYATHADQTLATYWRYRLAEATGLPLL